MPSRLYPYSLPLPLTRTRTRTLTRALTRYAKLSDAEILCALAHAPPDGVITQLALAPNASSGCQPAMAAQREVGYPYPYP